MHSLILTLLSQKQWETPAVDCFSGTNVDIISRIGFDLVGRGKWRSASKPSCRFRKLAESPNRTSAQRNSLATTGALYRLISTASTGQGQPNGPWHLVKSKKSFVIAVEAALDECRQKFMMQTADPVFEPARQLTSMAESFLSSHMLKKKETSSSGFILTEHLVAADRGNSSPASGLNTTPQRAHLDLNYTTGCGGWHLDTQSDVPDAIPPWPCKEHQSDATCILLNPDGRAKPSIGW
ncbi:hypothetical protein PGT21_029057 [Puccinia graminis f. sp. tritici]|uniref:Uncharacterized protein n=1 Tax=Puccinia graminis f. sp. tritici TaxID=56615 RepID=A0A5B0Q6S7_PUCGR|nr:hypothetical protein PGT21_029057 [Puccinia graminis f. sp. tritici]